MRATMASDTRLLNHSRKTVYTCAAPGREFGEAADEIEGIDEQISELPFGPGGPVSVPAAPGAVPGGAWPANRADAPAGRAIARSGYQ